jgi:hypothetical protein
MAKYYRFIVSVKPIMPATPVPKLTTTLVLPWEANCSTIFSASCLLRDFSDEFKFTYKTVSFSQTKHLAVAPFPMMLLKPSAVWFKSFGSACLDNGLRQRMFREFQFRQYRLAVLGSWFRLAENIETIGDP